MREVLGEADPDAIVELMPNDATTALLCVEPKPDACHRSLVAAAVAEQHGFDVVHITPRPRQGSQKKSSAE